MNSSEIIKLAQSNSEIAKALCTITKLAAEQTQFNEGVPTAPGGVPQGPAQPQVQPQPSGLPQAAPGMVDANAQAMQMAGAPNGGIDASRAFLSDIFAAASQGDQNAQRVIAITAAEMAKNPGAQPQAAMPQAPIEAAVADQIVADPNAPAPVAAVPVMPTTSTPAAPVAAAAPQADPAVQDPAAAAEGEAIGEEEGKKDEKEDQKRKDEKKDDSKKKPNPFEKKAEFLIDADTIAGIIKLAKAGVI